MDEAQILKAIRTILTIHEVHVNDDEGDRHIADPNLAIQAIEEAAYGNLRRAILDGFLTKEIVENSITGPTCAHCKGPTDSAKWTNGDKRYCCQSCLIADEEMIGGNCTINTPHDASQCNGVHISLDDI